MFTWDSSVKETSATTGTGNYTLDGAVTGYNAFSGMGLNNQCPYHARMGSNYEEGIGQILGSPSRLQRITIFRSSNANAAVNWGAGTKTIRCVMPAKMAVFRRGGANVASAATLNLDNVVGDYCAVTGTVQITAITLSEGREVTTVFTGACSIVQSGSLLTGTVGTLAVAVGDVALWRGEAGGIVRMTAYRRAGGFPFVLAAGTKMLFQQTAAPVGWTKDTSQNDKALRVVSGTVGTGGSLPFSTVFGRTATDGYTLAVADIPSHQHAAGGNILIEAGAAVGLAGAPYVSAGTSGTPNVSLTGGGGSHAHNIDIRVQYVDVIVASKD